MQAAICCKIAAERGWQLAHEPWTENFSGRKARPIFKTILEYIDAHPGEVQYYLFRSIDRFTRAGSLSYEEMKRELARRGVETVDTLGIIQPSINTLEELGFEYEWSRLYPSKAAEVAAAVAAETEVTTILTRLISQEIRLTQRGYKIRGPHDGYRNAKIYVDHRPRTIQEPDPERAKHFIEMFEMRASGHYTDAEICAHLNAKGFRTKRHRRWDENHMEVIGYGGERPLVPKQLQAIIQRTIYCGIVCEKWTRWLPVRAQYLGLVSIELFNVANRGKVFVLEEEGGSLHILHDHHPRKLIKTLDRNNPLFPYRHVVLCSTCHKPLLGSSPRGRAGVRYPTYHCARNHKYLGIRKETLDAVVEEFIGKLRFTPEAHTIIGARVLDLYHDRENERLEAVNAIERTIAELEVRKAEAVRAFKLATTDLLRRSFEAEAAAIQSQIESASSVPPKPEIAEREVEDYLRDAKRIMEHPSILLKNPASAQEQRALYSLVFERLPTYEEMRDGTAKSLLIHWLLWGDVDEKSRSVRLRRLEWNQIEQAIFHWKKVLLAFPSLKARLRDVPDNGSISLDTSLKS
jgi:DNA invertase Pin-like site-specific DNA recombinase